METGISKQRMGTDKSRLFSSTCGREFEASCSVIVPYLLRKFRIGHCRSGQFLERNSGDNGEALKFLDCFSIIGINKLFLIYKNCEGKIYLCVLIVLK